MVPRLESTERGSLEHPRKHTEGSGVSPEAH